MRLLALVRMYVTLLLVFVTQKVVFMLVNMGMAGGASVWDCLPVLWHGLRLDSVTACYLLLVPAIVLLISCFAVRMPVRKVLAPYWWIVAFAVGVLFVADTVLYLFWGAKLDANDLMYAAKPKDMLASLSWWMAALALAAVTLVVVHYYRRLRHATPRSLPRPRSPWLALLALPVGGLLLLGMRGSTSESTANPSYAYFSPYPFCNHAALNPTFNMLHSLVKAQNLETEFGTEADPELDRLLDAAFAPDSTLSDTLLSLQRPNILLLIWESGGSGMVLNDSVGPCLTALVPQGIYFSNLWANNFRTDRGLISILNGWPGLPTTSLMKRTDICRQLPSLARTLREAGYATSFAYGGDIDFTNMRLYLSETGFTTLRGGQQFPPALYTSAWGVPDEHLLAPDLIPKQRPFLAAALTLSSHEPWDVPYHRLPDAKQNAFAYTDSCLGAFVEGLRQMPVWDSLLVIILPDHGIAYPGVSTAADPRAARIPMLWLGGAIRQPAVVDRLMNQSDLAATLLAQLHLDATSFVFSRNTLSTGYPSRMPFATHAYKNGLNLIRPDGTASYDCVNRAPVGAASAADEAFFRAYLRRLYQTTGSLPRQILQRP